MEDVLARLVKEADSLSALQLTGALWKSLSNTPTPPPNSSLTPASSPPLPPLFGPLRSPRVAKVFECQVRVFLKLYGSNQN